MDSIWVCLVNGYDVENVCTWQKVLRGEISWWWFHHWDNTWLILAAQ
jgi:hypothetical protein